MSNSKEIARILVILALFAPVAIAQNAEITGRVTDPSRAVVPQAEIMVVNTDTGTARRTSSNDEGYYAVPILQPGKYRLTAQKSGFKPVARDGIVLQVGDRLTLNIAMEVGTAAETVTVVGEVPLLRTEDEQAGLVIDNKRIQGLAQYNRDVLAFVFLTANVSGSSQNDLRINGSRSGQIEYFIDGVPVTTGYLHTVPPSVPSMEAVSEFKVLTNGLSSEYGRLSGGAVVLATRSGTNNFHGSVYEFFRNDKLNANDWNSNRYGRAKGVFHDNVFGGTFGGPVWIPKVYDGHDKTFFFLNYEGTRRSTGSNVALASVPTALEKQGDFSQSLYDRAVPVQIFDPLTSTVEGSRVRRNPFPGNRIPASRFNPLSKIYLDYFPEPNQAPLPGSNNNTNYIGSVAYPSSNDRWTGRLDQNWNSRHMTHGSISLYSSNSSSPRWISALQPASISTSTAYTASVDHTWTLSPTTVLNFRGGVVRPVSYTGSEVDADSSNWGLQREVVNLLGTYNNRVPSIGTGDYLFTPGGGSVNAVNETSYTGAFSVQKIWGKHSIKVGYEHRRYYSNVTSGGSFNITTDRRVTSQYYDNPVTGLPFASWLLGVPNWGQGTQLAGPASLQTYHGLYGQDDIKLTRKLTLNLGLRWDYEPPRTERYNRQMVWDPNYKWDWKPNADWSWNQVQQEAGITFAQPAWITQGVYGRIAMLGTPEYPYRSWQKTYPRHLGPRAGIAYQFLPRTVVRVGYGLNWLTMTGDSFLDSANQNTGYGDFARMAQDGTANGGLTYLSSFNVPLPNGQGYVPFTRDILALNLSTMGNWLIVPAYNQYPGYEHAVQLNLQREVGSGTNVWVLEASYSGNFGRDLPFFGNYHSVPDAYHALGVPLGDNLNTLVSNPFYGQIPAGTTMGGATNFLGRVLQVQPLWREVWGVNEPMGYSNYHAAYFQVEHRFARGFSFLANYTFSKMLQAGGGIGAQGINSVGVDGNSQGPPQANLPMSDIYGLAPFDVTHRLVVNYVVDLPFGRGKRFLRSPDTFGKKLADKVIGGWSMAGTTLYRGGTPFSIICASGYCRNWITIGEGKLTRPRFVDPRIPYDNGVSGHTALQGASGFQYYFNPDAFRPVQGVEIGDVGSTLQGMRGPGFSQWDFALMKNFGLGKESRYAQIRFEAQNLFNHMNAGPPNNALPNLVFGMITTQNGSPRVVMMAAKIYF
jgi:hypothetical protein